MGNRSTRASDQPKFQDEVLVGPLRPVLAALGPLTAAAGLYLAGGTSLALRLGHRRSADLNWFAPELDEKRFAAQLAEARAPVTIRKTAPGTLHGESEGIHVSFVAYPYVLVRPRVRWEELGCDLASLLDIGCQKLAAVAQRGLFRDFIDLHAIVRAGHPLEELLESYQEKYATKEIAHLLPALTYFEDADREPRPELLRPVDWHAVQRDFAKWTKHLAAD